MDQAEPSPSQQNETLIAFQHAQGSGTAGSDLEKSAAAWLQLAEVYQAQGKPAKQIRYASVTAVAEAKGRT